MARKIAWRVVFETDHEKAQFPIAISFTKINDATICRYLKECVDDFSIPYSADDIYHLWFIAIPWEDDFDDVDTSYIEPLSPFDFWPNLPEKTNPKNRRLFRE